MTHEDRKKAVEPLVRAMHDNELTELVAHKQGSRVTTTMFRGYGELVLACEVTDEDPPAKPKRGRTGR